MADDGWNGNGSGNTLFTNVRVLDATGEYPYTGEVLVQGNRIKQITKGSSRFGSSSASLSYAGAPGGVTTIDG
ncbi:MAG: amidohydrolase family protein, partial [Mesorhizobium sp.]